MQGNPPPAPPLVGRARYASPGPARGGRVINYSPRTWTNYMSHQFLQMRENYTSFVAVASSHWLNIAFNSLLQGSFGPDQMVYITTCLIFFFLNESNVQLPEVFWESFSLIVSLFPGNWLAILRVLLWMFSKFMNAVRTQERKHALILLSDLKYSIDVDNHANSGYFLQSQYRNLIRVNSYLRVNVHIACVLLLIVHACVWFMGFVQQSYGNHELRMHGNSSNANPVSAHVVPTDFLDMGGMNVLPDLDLCTNYEQLQNQREFNKMLYSTVQVHAMQVYLVFTKQNSDILSLILKVAIVFFCTYCGIFSVVGTMMFKKYFEVQKLFRRVLYFILLLYVVFIAWSLVKQDLNRYLHVQYDQNLFGGETTKVFISLCGGDATEVYDASKVQHWKNGHENLMRHSEPCRTIYGCKKHRFYEQCLQNKPELFEYPKLPMYCENLHSIDTAWWYLYVTGSFFFEHNTLYVILALMVFLAIRYVIRKYDTSLEREFCVDGKEPHDNSRIPVNSWSYSWSNVKPNARTTLKRVLIVLFVCNAAVQYLSNSCLTGKKALSMDMTLKLEEMPFVFPFPFQGMQFEWLSHCIWQVNTWLIYQYNSSTAHIFCVCMVFGAPFVGVNGENNHGRLEFLSQVILLVNVPIFCVVDLEAILTQNGLGRNQMIINCGLYVILAVNLLDWYSLLVKIDKDGTLCPTKIIMTSIPLKSGNTNSQMHKFFEELIIVFLSLLMIFMNCCGQLVFAWSIVSIVFLYTTWCLHKCMLHTKTQSETDDVCQTFLAVQQHEIADDDHDKSSLIQIVFPFVLSGLIHCFFSWYLHKQAYRNDTDGFFSYILFSKQDSTFFYRTIFDQMSHYNIFHNDSSQVNIRKMMKDELNASMMLNYIYDLKAYIIIFHICVYCLCKCGFGFMVQSSRDVLFCSFKKSNTTSESTYEYESKFLQFRYTTSEPLVGGVPNIYVIMAPSEYITPT